MITRIHGKVVFECDRCGNSLETGEHAFQDALQAMRDAGWKAEKITAGAPIQVAEWTHNCEECK